MEHTEISKVWPEWSVVEQIGAGTYGVVYKAVRREHAIESFSAIKVISVPQNRSELNALYSEGLSLDETKTYFEGVVNDFINEIRVMGTLKGHSNIVSVEDYKVVEHSDSIGWDIYIRMELLTPFDQYILGREFTQQEVADLGSAICKALSVCHQKGIIHRDVKPENIFVNEYGYFKLGDFGVARKLENLSGSMSQKGTYHYMAPEVAGGTHYDTGVDIYSLGIVLYRLLNENHLPFLDTEEQIKDPFARKQALERRLKGESLPAPKNASPEMTRVILRACAFDPQQRFESAETLDKALQAAARGENVDSITDDWDKTVAVKRPPVSLDQTVRVRPLQGVAAAEKTSGMVPTFGGKSQNQSATLRIALKGLLAALAIVAVVLVTIVITVKARDSADKRAAQEQLAAQQEEEKAEAEKRAEEELAKAEEERAKAEEERAKAEEERAKAEEERAKAEEERAKAEEEARLKEEEVQRWQEEEARLQEEEEQRQRRAIDISNIDYTIDNYLYAFIEDINSGRYSAMYSAVEYGSNFEKSQKSFLDSVNLYEELINYEIVSRIEINKNTYHVTTIEDYDVYNYDDDTECHIQQKCVYKLSRQSDGTWRISDFVENVEQLDKYYY